MIARVAALLAVAMALLTARGARAAEGVPLRRFALVVAANDGGPERERLRYAEGDARAFAEVLEQLGGVDPRDARALRQPGARELSAAFGELAARLREAEQRGTRTELIFYYSGHSDESALLLGTERVSYAELRRMLEQLPTQVRVAILDSCASGAFTRDKGGVARPPFMVDVSTQVRGHAFLTSSSADEAAQESDRIGGSFFTHYLVSGLRGAADASGDRKITLTEAYRFAFEETLARTAPTQFGSQHPAYEIRLAGTGDLVLTDLRSTQAELIIDETVEGRLFVWDAPRKLLVEVDKPRGKRVVLAVPPHALRLELSRGAQFFVAEVQALAGRPLIVHEPAFRRSERESTLARGVVEQFAPHPFAASVIPPLSTNQEVRREQGKPVLNHVDVAVLYDDPDALSGMQLSLFGAAARLYMKGLQLGLAFNDAGEMFGLQLSAGASVARSYAYGVQLSGLGNHGGTDVLGLQLAALFNHAHTSRGAQLALGLNIARAQLYGLQTGAVSWARRVDGWQIGGLNLARDVNGLQLGLMNVAAGSVRGAQLGVVNYADEADFSFALLGITRQGGAHLELSLDELMTTLVALRLEAKYNYSFVSVGAATWERGARGFSIGAGLGGKVPLPLAGLWLDFDLGFHMLQPMWSYYTGLPNTLHRLRAMVRYDLFAHLSVFAGLTVNVQLSLRESERFTPSVLTEEHEPTQEGSPQRVRVWPGLTVGLRL